jgi:hypothetical protein
MAESDGGTADQNQPDGQSRALDEDSPLTRRTGADAIPTQDEAKTKSEAMVEIDTEAINRELIRLVRRADSRPSLLLVDTFVDVGHLFARLSTDDHQVIYGRRGTGKTHALYYLVEYARRRQHAAVFVDLRTSGSSGGIYNDPSRTVSERGTALLIDVLEALHSGIIDHVYGQQIDSPADELVELTDLLAATITQTRVMGEYERELSSRHAQGSEDTTGASLSVTSKGPGLELSSKSTENDRGETEVRERFQGTERPYVHFGAISRTLGRIINTLQAKRLWVILDEWSSIPLDLQPLLADLLRRSLFPVRGITVKIGAIPDRSSFRIHYDTGDYIGFELGSDISVDVNLDDFISYAKNPQAAKEFFAQMFHARLREILPDEQLYGPPRKLIQGGQIERSKTVDRFLNRAFKYGAFPELVRAAEGIPRDAICIASNAAQHAGSRPIKERQVSIAARDWCMQDKEGSAVANDKAIELLHWLVDEVVGSRNSTAFFLQQDTDAQHLLVRYLYDARLLHIISKDVAANDKRGMRFTLFKLDYGLYLDIGPGHAPPSTFRATTGQGDQWVDFDDLSPRYESINSALIELPVVIRPPNRS